MASIEKGTDSEIKESAIKLFNLENEYFLKKTGLFTKTETFENKSDKSKLLVSTKKVKFSNTKQNIDSALKIAKDKGWQSIQISTKDKIVAQKIWLEAGINGIEAKGYEPNQYDNEELERAKQAQEAIKIKPSLGKSQEKQTESDKPLSKDLQKYISDVVQETSSKLEFDLEQKKFLKMVLTKKIEKKIKDGVSLSKQQLKEKKKIIREKIPDWKAKMQETQEKTQQQVKQKTNDLDNLVDKYLDEVR